MNGTELVKILDKNLEKHKCMKNTKITERKKINSLKLVLDLI